MNAAGFVLYLLFMSSWFLHLPARFEALGAVRADLALVMLVMLLSFAGDDEGAVPPTDLRTRNLLYILVGYAALSIPLVQWPGSVVRTGFPNFFKAFVFFLFTAKYVTTTKRLRILLIV